jgi:CubicO group peptidase (beta-lactamase class C family)
MVFWLVGFAFASPNAEIGALMNALSERGQFNGAILVAQRGKIIYRNAFGKANFQTGADFTPETPSNIGSVTKQFTAMAVMILAERNKLQYDDPVAKYIPEFSRATHLGKITLRHLLTHTSGMPDYDDLAICWRSSVIGFQEGVLAISSNMKSSNLSG